MDITDHAHAALSELSEIIIEPGTYADMACETIGEHIFDSIFELEELESPPIVQLYSMLAQGWRLDIESLRDEDGKLYADDGSEIPSGVRLELSAAQHLATCAVFLLMDGDYLGTAPSPMAMVFDGLTLPEILTHMSNPKNNELALSDGDVLLHISEHVLTARQAFSYALTFIVGELRDNKSEHLQPSIISEHASKNGKKGSDIKYAPLRKLRAWAVEKYREKKWRSANKAAYELMPAILEHAKKIGVPIAESNAQRTFAEWFRKSA